MQKVWLIGAGNMAQDYIQVLKALNVDFTVLGRGQITAQKCEEETGCTASSRPGKPPAHTGSPNCCSL